MSEGTHLPGLRGDTPDGFLAGLGVLAAYDGQPDPPRLWWDGTHAVVDDRFTIQQIADRALAALRQLSDSPAMAYKIDGKPIEDVKFTDRADTKAFLEPSHGDKLSACLTAEGAYDKTKNKKAKPTAWDFTAGQQGFINKIRVEVMASCISDPGRLTEALTDPYAGEVSTVKSLGWSQSTDRVAALSGEAPSGGKIIRHIGREALGVLGLSFHPVFAAYPPGATTGRALTMGFRNQPGAGKSGESYVWPLWSPPASAPAVRALLAAVSAPLSPTRLADMGDRYEGWGITRIMASAVDRGSKAQGYGMFRPPKSIWSPPVAG